MKVLKYHRPKQKLKLG